MIKVPSAGTILDFKLFLNAHCVAIVATSQDHAQSKEAFFSWWWFYTSK